MDAYVSLTVDEMTHPHVETTAEDGEEIATVRLSATVSIIGPRAEVIRVLEEAQMRLSVPR